MAVIRVGVQAPQGSAGQFVDLDGVRASIARITNAGAESVAFSLNGGSSWTTLAAGASGGGGTIDAGMLRLRKVASGGYPVVVDIDATPFGVSTSSISDAEFSALQSVVAGAGEFSTRPLSATGRITGSGAAQSFNLGFRADLVLGKADSASYVGFFKTEAAWLRNTDTLTTSAARSDAVYLTSTGFSVGADAVVNANAVTIDYFAWGDNGSNSVRSVSWQGNATTGRTVDITSGLDIQAAIIKRDSAADSVLVIGSESWLSNGTSGAYAAINSDGTLTLNNSANTNEWAGVSGEACNALLLLNKPENIKVARYTGNATARRIPLPWKPAAVLIWPLGNSASQIQIWTAGMPANTSGTSNGAAHQTGRITAVDDSGVSIGSGASVNANGIGFAMIAFRDMGSAHERRAPAYIARSSKVVQLSTGYIDCGTSDTLAISGAYSLEWYGSFTAVDETPFVGGSSAVNDETGKQHPLIWRSNGADGGSSTTSQSWGLGLYAPMNQGVAAWRGCSILSPSTQFFNLVQNSSGNLDYNPVNTGYVIDTGRLAHIVAVHEGSGVWKYYVDGLAIKERKRSILTAAGGPLKADGAYPLSGASTIIGARKRASTPEFAHSAAFRRARVYSRGLTAAEARALYLHATRGGSDPASDFVEEWDANNASGTSQPATRYAANNGTISAGVVIG